jgi:hypothetical protein
MDPVALRAWIAAKIEEHTPDVELDGTRAVRLLDAVAALRRTPGKATVFGVALPEQGVSDPEPLIARGIELLRIWEQVIDPASRDELAMLAQKLHIHLDSQPRPVHPPTTHQLHVWLPVVLEDSEADEETLYTAWVQSIASTCSIFLACAKRRAAELVSSPTTPSMVGRRGARSHWSSIRQMGHCRPD